MILRLADNQSDELSSKLVETYGTDLPDLSYLLQAMEKRMHTHTSPDY